jgi:precorrin-6A/cobalt-precorrin-6A reductase
MAANSPRALILGGTGEARAIAERAHRAGLDVILSLAGRTTAAAPSEAPTRSGGFGGVDGLVAYLREQRIARVLDATHPFAARMSANAVAACAIANIPRLALLREAWRAQNGDIWTYVDDVAQAAGMLPSLGRRIFVAFADGLAPLGAARLAFVVRRVESQMPTFPNVELVAGRGPFRVDDEIALFRDKRIDAILAKDSGGAGASAKLDAARHLRLPVVLIRRPAVPPGPSTSDPDQAGAWLGLDGAKPPSL